MADALSDLDYSVQDNYSATWSSRLPNTDIYIIHYVALLQITTSNLSRPRRAIDKGYTLSIKTSQPGAVI